MELLHAVGNPGNAVMGLTCACSRTHVRSSSRSCMARAVNSKDIVDLSLQPFQPKRIVFPSQSFGKSALVSCLFQTMLFNKFK